MWSHRFYETVTEALGGKARGNAVWVPNDAWEDANFEMPQFRQPGYNNPALDWSQGNWWARAYDEGCDAGFAAGLQQGKGQEAAATLAQAIPRRSLASPDVSGQARAASAPEPTTTVPLGGMGGGKGGAPVPTTTVPP